ncbi:MAG: [Lachnospiraceae bacterium]|nr:[FeFe] hydrogenase H-cluster maturation GTPase HydF [Lachnospiraceae bacterium]
MASMQETPSANRLHIGVFGKTNSGKSSFLNAFCGQEVSIVSDIAGTTTDTVTKAMEISPLGACVFMDTAGFDDMTELGEKRVEKTRLSAEKADIAVFVVSKRGIVEKESFDIEQTWISYFKEKKVPVLVLINNDISIKIKEDILKLVESSQNQTVICEQSALIAWKKTNNLNGDNIPIIEINAKTGEGMDKVKEQLARLMPEQITNVYITGNLVTKEDVVLLVMPQDIQAPKGRLILPQVQTIRELLDKKCIVVSVTTDKMKQALSALVKPPKLIITDSQVFDYVYQNKPKESQLTSFSVLFAAYKGDLVYYVEGAKMIDSLTEHSKVLIAECCTHAPLSEDIGRVKIPAMLRKRFGQGLQVDMVSGTDYPQDLSSYDLIIQCGACMFHRQYVLSRIERAKNQQVPMTNYGVTIAHLTGILDKITLLE